VFQELLHELEGHLSEFLECLCLTASAGYGRAARLSVFQELLHKFLECLCLTASAGYGRAARLSVFQELLRELEEHLSEFLEVLYPFLATLSLFLASGHHERGMLYPYLATFSLFLASLHRERDLVGEVAPTRLAHRAHLNGYTPPATSPSSIFFACLVGDTPIHGSQHGLGFDVKERRDDSAMRRGMPRCRLKAPP
jgi:hypothetical protein